MSVLRSIRRNIRNRLVSGMLVLVPVGVTLLIMRWGFNSLAEILKPVLEAWMRSRGWEQATQDRYIMLAVSAISIVLLLLLLYFAGAIAQLVVGKKAIDAGERLLMRIPLVRTVYAATKQVIEAVSMPERAAFKSVVMVEFPRRGMWCPGFLTGEMEGYGGVKMARVYIPTTPNPTSGFFEIMPFSELIPSNMTVEEAFRMIISGGILAPKDMGLTRPLPVSDREEANA